MATPINLTAVPSGTQVALSWTGTIGAGITFNVYRGTSSGNESVTPIATGLVTTTYTDTTVSAGLTYFYKVTTVISGIESTKSNEADANIFVQIPFNGSTNTASVTSSVLAPNATDTSHTINMGKCCIIYSATLSAPAWVRLYSTAAAQSADSNRSYGAPSPLNMGLIEDVYSVAGNLGPFVRTIMGVNSDSPQQDKFYCTITNVSSITQAVTINYSYCPIAQ